MNSRQVGNDRPPVPGSAAALALGLLLLAPACAVEGEAEKPGIQPVGEGTRLAIGGIQGLGLLHLWLPEAIMTDRGASSLYPVGGEWIRRGDTWSHEVGADALFGPGNYRRVDDGTLAIGPVEFPLEPPVAWKTTVASLPNRVEYTIQLTNVAREPLRKVGAAVCLSFGRNDWWSDEQTFARSDGRVRSLAQLGRQAGEFKVAGVNDFQAYLLCGESFANAFYRRLWGINRSCLERPMIVSYNRPSRLAVSVSARHAYFLHSNKGTPCTDVMVAFGDVQPGATATASGSVEIHRGGGVKRILARKH